VKPWIVVLIIAAAVLIFGAVFYTFFEIVPYTRFTGPSGEAEANPFLALDRWLAETGHPVRVLERGNLNTLAAGPEKTVYVEDSCFSWIGEGETAVILTDWIRGGGNLIAALNDATVDWRLEEYLDGLGIEVLDRMAQLERWEEEQEEGEAENTAGGEAPGEEAAGEGEAAAEAPEGGAETPEEGEEERSPAFEGGVSFRINKKAPEVDKISVMTETVSSSRGGREEIRLLRLYMGKGTLTLSGRSYFFNSYNLNNRANAELAAALLAEPESSAAGVLFIRGFLDKNRLFGALIDRGDLRPLGAALITLIVLGFWMAVPPFGRPRPLSAWPGKPLRERFLAEGLFLKKYGALDKYVEAYRRELEQRRGTGGPETGRPERVIPKAPDWVETKKHAKSCLEAFMRYQREAMDILEGKRG
jgi:hypothetical protein